MAYSERIVLWLWCKACLSAHHGRAGCGTVHQHYFGLWTGSVGSNPDRRHVKRIASSVCVSLVRKRVFSPHAAMRKRAIAYQTPRLPQVNRMWLVPFWVPYVVSANAYPRCSRANHGTRRIDSIHPRVCRSQTNASTTMTRPDESCFWEERLSSLCPLSAPTMLDTQVVLVVLERM